MIFESKREAIEYCLKEHNFLHTNIITKENFINCISKHLYNIKKDLNISTTRKVTKFLAENFPNRDRIHDKKICCYIFRINNLKYCTNCCKVKSLDYYHSNNSKKDKVNGFCITCDRKHKQENSELCVFWATKYKTQKILAMPKWLTEDQIINMKNFYLNCPESYQVDHIIPLQGKNVCGLHIPWNLQYLTKKENLQKSNKLIQ